jgi:protein-S-isoprenylcysteine O-methyltransferase Ste14
MLARAILAFVALPGMVAFALPLWLAAGKTPAGWALSGGVLVVIGAAGLLRCVRGFYVTGEGTLASWSPPRKLVTVGLFRYTRNPMYVSVLLILLGWAVLFRSAAHLVYAAAVGAVFHLHVVFAEEPWAERVFGDEWRAYRDRVPRWFGSRR